MLPQVNEFEEILVQTGLLAVLLEKGFVGTGCTGSDDNPVEILFLDFETNGRKAIFRTGVKVPFSVGNMRE
jgi:hypothetical protein